MSIISKELESKLDGENWFHGSKEIFDSWSIPSPQKAEDYLIVRHINAIFFTSNRNFAEKSGKKVAKVSISQQSNILDATANYDAIEKLRQLVKKNEFLSRSINVEQKYWHQGWKTGKVLRLAYSDSSLTLILKDLALDISEREQLPIEAAELVVGHNTARGLIELICQSAQELGFDAIYGYEIDKDFTTGREVSQPWLAVFNKDLISPPKWD